MRLSNSTHKIALRNSLNLLRFFTFLSANTPSVWINSTVKATGDTFSLDKQHYRRRTSRSRSIFSLDKQHCVEAGWLSIPVSVEKDFRGSCRQRLSHQPSRRSEVLQVPKLGTSRAELFYDRILADWFQSSAFRRPNDFYY